MSDATTMRRPKPGAFYKGYAPIVTLVAAPLMNSAPVGTFELLINGAVAIVRAPTAKKPPNRNTLKARARRERIGEKLEHVAPLWLPKADLAAIDADIETLPDREMSDPEWATARIVKVRAIVRDWAKRPRK